VARKKSTRRRSPRRSGIVEMSIIKAGAGFAVGGFGAEFALRKLPLPAAFTASPMAQGATVIGLGLLTAYFGKKFVGRTLATSVDAGMVGNGLIRVLGSATGMAGMGGLAGEDVYGYDGLAGFSLGEIEAMTDGEFDGVLANIGGHEEYAAQVNGAISARYGA